jgi:hypothetical protein
MMMELLMVIVWSYMDIGKKLAAAVAVVTV